MPPADYLLPFMTGPILDLVKRIETNRLQTSSL